MTNQAIKSIELLIREAIKKRRKLLERHEIENMISNEELIELIIIESELNKALGNKPTLHEDMEFIRI